MSQQKRMVQRYMALGVKRRRARELVLVTEQYEALLMRDRPLADALERATRGAR